MSAETNIPSTPANVVNDIASDPFTSWQQGVEQAILQHEEVAQAGLNETFDETDQQLANLGTAKTEAFTELERGLDGAVGALALDKTLEFKRRPGRFRAMAERYKERVKKFTPERDPQPESKLETRLDTEFPKPKGRLEEELMARKWSINKSYYGAIQAQRRGDAALAEKLIKNIENDLVFATRAAHTDWRGRPKFDGIDAHYRMILAKLRKEIKDTPRGETEPVELQKIGAQLREGYLGQVAEITTKIAKGSWNGSLARITESLPRQYQDMVLRAKAEYDERTRKEDEEMSDETTRKNPRGKAQARAVAARTR